MDLTPAKHTQFYVDRMNTFLTTPELVDFRIVKGGASVQLQHRAEPGVPYKVIYETDSLDMYDERNLLLALDTVLDTVL